MPEKLMSLKAALLEAEPELDKAQLQIHHGSVYICKSNGVKILETPLNEDTRQMQEPAELLAYWLKRLRTKLKADEGGAEKANGYDPV